MSNQTRLTFIMIFLLLTACTPGVAPIPSPSPTDMPQSVPTQISTTTPSTRTVDELIKIIYASDPTLPQYNPQSPVFSEFPDALKQLAEMGPDAIDAASSLAVAITYPRQDSYLAAQTLLSLGPDNTKTAIVILFDNLNHLDSNVKIYSLILLGTAGNHASCAVGDIAPLLWDSDPLVRTSAAFTLEKIIGQDLISSEYEIEITPSFLAHSITADTPEGTVVSEARKWWDEQGSKINWHPGYGICDP